MIKDILGKQLLFFDGAMATMLQSSYSAKNESIELWNIAKPDIVRNVHRQYLAAGCDIIKTNTFGCNAFKLKDTGFSAEQITESAVANVKAAAAEFAQVKPRFTALDIGSTGRLLKPLGDLGFEEAVSLFKQVIACGAEAGADLVLIETMSDTYELKAAVLAAKESCRLPVIASVTLNEKGKLLTGGGIEVVIALLEGLSVDAIGINCGFGPDKLMPYVHRALELSSLPILFMPNAGMPVVENGITKYSVLPDEFAQTMRKSAESGVRLLGGCCGTTPAHIEALVQNCSSVAVKETPRKSLTVACSNSKAVVFGTSSTQTVIIGERINPTGKPKLKQALKDGDFEFVLREGIAQTEQGASVLDVNAGMPGIDEVWVLASLVEQLQAGTSTPLQIDSADLGAMERAMRIYNGKPLVNSVNGKEDSMNAVFPLIKKYGGVAAALTLDENGIPETVQGRIEIAEKILKKAAQFGIGRNEFLFDPLTMALSAGQNNALVTLECVRRFKEELGVKTILGISNISFGLPCRQVLNACFLSLAIEAGLDAAIVNPAINYESVLKDGDREIAVNALLGKDDQFARYIETYGTLAAKIPAQKIKDKTNSLINTDISLTDAVFKGLKQEAAESAKKSLKNASALDVIEKELIPALNSAGECFEKGTIYLPQLLMCAEAAKAAFGVIRQAMGSTADDTLGTVVIATVEGDVHDIGKNIARAMLENYRFKVIDLGKNVGTQAVVQAMKEHNAKLVGLSALMTTTVSSMEKTIKALREEASDCKIMCGGAVLTKEYAESIGADCYVKDAMASVRYAQEVYKT